MNYIKIFKIEEYHPGTSDPITLALRFPDRDSHIYVISVDNKIKWGKIGLCLDLPERMWTYINDRKKLVSTEFWEDNAKLFLLTFIDLPTNYYKVLRSILMSPGITRLIYYNKFDEYWEKIFRDSGISY